jgi:hypothetical protein
LFGVCEAAMAAALVAPADLAHAELAGKLGAVVMAIYLAAVGTAANNDLRPTAHAYNQSDWRQCRESLSMPMRYRQG